MLFTVSIMQLKHMTPFNPAIVKYYETEQFNKFFSQPNEFSPQFSPLCVCYMKNNTTGNCEYLLGLFK